MSHLVLLVISIALVSLLALATINYLPWWTKYADQVEEQTRTALVRLEQAYDVAARGDNGVPPAVQASPDGGFEAIFLPVMKVLPPTPGNTSWIYGQHADDGGPYANMHYFCLKADEAGGDTGLWRGAVRAASNFSQQQAFINTGCDMLSSVPLPSSYPSPFALTLYVAYVPGIDK